MGVRERGVCDVRRDAHGRRLQRGWLGFFPTPLPGAFDWMLSGDGSISREYAHLGVVCPQKLWITRRDVDKSRAFDHIVAAAPPGAAASRPMPPRRASPDAWRRPAAQVSRLDSDAASHRMRARKPMTMPRVVCPSPVSSVDGNQSIGTLTHAGCRNTVVFSSASGGAGTSVFAAMVAWRLAQRKLQCALVDCDFAAGGIDVLLGIENEPGLRFQTVDIPLGKTEGAALNGELPQWERVGVLASQPWNGSDPEPWTVSAVLEALAQANDVVVVDIGAPSALHSLPMLRQCRQVVLAELTVLGLARARAARAMMIRQGESRPIMVGVVPRGLSRRGGVVDAHEASEYLHEELAGVVAPDRGLHGDVLEGLGIRAIGKSSRKAVDAVVGAIETGLGGDVP